MKKVILQPNAHIHNILDNKLQVKLDWKIIMFKKKKKCPSLFSIVLQIFSLFSS